MFFQVDVEKIITHLGLSVKSVGVNGCNVKLLNVDAKQPGWVN